MKICELKIKIEKETGLKLNMSRHNINSSMKGYIKISVRGNSNCWGFNYAKKLKSFLLSSEPHPIFCNNYSLDIYFGVAVFNDNWKELMVKLQTNGKICLRCGEQLIGRKLKFCSESCKYWYKQINKPLVNKRSKAQQLRMDRASRKQRKMDVRYN